MTRIAPLAVCLAIIASCGAPRLDIVHRPRFCHGGNRIPPPRAGYPLPWLGISNHFKGFDMMFRFTPPEKKADHDIVQSVKAKFTQHMPNANTGQCDRFVPRPMDFVIERFKLPANDVQFQFEPPVEMKMHIVIEGVVAYFPLPGQPPGFAKDANVVILHSNAPHAPPSWINSLPPGDRKWFDRSHMNEASFTQWKISYQYDGCHNPPEPFETFCGRRHCLQVVWWKVDRGKRGPDRTAAFKMAENDDLNGPNCPEAK